MPKKTPKSDQQLVPVETIEKRIFLIRGQKVMLDFDLAELYQVATKRSTRLLGATSTGFRLTSCFNSRKKKPAL